MAAPMNKVCLLPRIRCFTNFRRFQLTHCQRNLTSVAHALVYESYGDPRSVVKIQEQQLPEVSDDEVKVQMIAAPINPADINTIQGQYPIKPTLPAVGGFEGVGEVLEVGHRVTNVKLGDKVISNTATLGSWRTHLVCNSSAVRTLPEGTPLLFAATVRVNMSTAYRLLQDFEDLQPGDCVIQNAANSGAGQAVIQIAAARGVNTINIVRDRPDIEDLRSYLQGLGATIVTTESELRQNEKSIMQDVPKPKLALNAVSGKSCFVLLKQLQPKRTMVTYGGMSRQPVMVPTSSLIFSDIKVRGYWMSRWHEETATDSSVVGTFWPGSLFREVWIGSKCYIHHQGQDK
ncbi:enoyl-[acyl-carrier-protein] reductase, mitochondrial-like isoform X3 [Apostichopus japonicus]|uniref:enoyl-[acyl-carrier-protein] reductase, mitochondrial-like isoform X3 n=1 Tax=Stichopus japonicus TaxID=307972 RepID=UPI003AB76434